MPITGYCFYYYYYYYSLSYYFSWLRLTLAGTGGGVGMQLPLGFSKNTYRTSQQIAMKLVIPTYLTFENVYIFSKNVKAVPTMTFDLWPDIQGRVKRNLLSVTFWRL